VLGAAAATVFVLAVGGITGLESIIGEPLSALFGHGHDARSSVGQVFGGNSAPSTSRPAPATTNPTSVPGSTSGPTASTGTTPTPAPTSPPAGSSASTTAPPLSVTPTAPAPGPGENPSPSP
jgi:hypothetical protein